MPEWNAILGQLRGICLALPGASERLSHGMPAFHGGRRTLVCLKTAGRDEQNLLIEADPELYSWVLYLGPFGWVGMNLAPANTDWAHVGERVRASYDLAGRARPRARQ